MHTMAARGGKTAQQGIKAHFTRKSKAATTNSEASLASPASATGANASSMDANLPPEMESLHRLMTASMENIIAPLRRTMDEVKVIVEDQGKRIDDLEENATQLTERVTALESICEQLLAQNESLNERMEDASNRSRRCNLRVTNILEKSPEEKSNCVQFMQNFFAKVLGDVFTEPPILDRAHRIGKENTGPRPRPRVMIVRFHYFQDKMRALRADRSLLQWKGQKVMFYPDYAPATAKLRATFSKVKAQMWKKNVRFRLVFPAILKVEFKNKTHVFKTAGDAQQFYEKRIARLPDMERNTAAKPARRGGAYARARGDTDQERAEENGAGLGEEDGTHERNGSGGEDEATTEERQGGLIGASEDMEVEEEYDEVVSDSGEEEELFPGVPGNNAETPDEAVGTV